MIPLIEAPPLPALTLEEIKMFHEMDRNLYSRLTKDFGRDPIESMRVMALWLWLEQSGYTNLVKIISDLPNFLINEIADEAMICLNFLTNSIPFRDQIDLPISIILLGNDFSLNFFALNRGEAILGIRKALTETCLRALQDLMQLAIERNTMSSLVEPGFSRMNLNNNPPEAVHPDDRTIFATFSKGYPVPESDIREFFDVMYGDCIESLHIGAQSVYACIVFYTPDIIEKVLNGVKKVKFTIKGRQMWMRKFVSKRRTSLYPLAPLRFGVSGSGSGSSAVL